MQQQASNPWQSIPIHPTAFNSTPPVSTALYGTTASWAHTVPSLMPWVPVNQPSAPLFSTDPCTSHTPTSWEMVNGPGASRNLHLKRKGELDLTETSPPKLCITEERMAARFKEMHISNQFTPPSPPQATCIKDLMLNNNSEEDSLSSAKSLVLAPEIKKLVEPEKIFASTFFNKVERPSMALVVWQPQQQVFGTNKRKEQEETNTFVPIDSLCPSEAKSENLLSTTALDEEMDD